jgi:phosphinothricin acetyltransferase
MEVSMSGKAAITLARDSDALAILAIYEPYIKESAITFEYIAPTLGEFKQRIIKISEEYPFLVYRLDNSIVGYAYAHRHMERSAYQWNAEASVYVQPSYTQKGIGTALYKTLLALLKLQNVKNVYAGVTLPNPASERLHASFGFKTVGIYHNTGFKCGSWHDVGWFEKQIGAYDLDPIQFISIAKIDKQTIEKTILDSRERQ